MPVTFGVDRTLGHFAQWGTRGARYRFLPPSVDGGVSKAAATAKATRQGRAIHANKR